MGISTSECSIVLPFYSQSYFELLFLSTNRSIMKKSENYLTEDLFKNGNGIMHFLLNVTLPA